MYLMFMHVNSMSTATLSQHISGALLTRLLQLQQQQQQQHAMNGYSNGSRLNGSYTNGHSTSARVDNVDNCSEDSNSDDNDNNNDDNNDDSSSDSGSDSGDDDTDAVVAGECLAADNAVSALGCLCEYMANWSSAVAASGESPHLFLLQLLTL
jgi:hypothetical protein